MKTIKQYNKIFSVFIAIVFALSILTLNTFAYTENSTNNIDFENQPLPIVSSRDEAEANGILWYTVTNNSTGNSTIYKVGSQSADNLYAVAYNAIFNEGTSSQYTGIITAIVRPWITSDSDAQKGITYYTNQYSNIQGGGQNYYYRTINNVRYGFNVSTTNLINSSNTYNIHVPMFNSINDALDAIGDWIENPPPPPAPAHYFAGSLAPGYVAVFDIGGLSDIEIVLGTTLFSGYKYSGYSTSQAAGMTPTMPTSISLPLSYTSSISWQGSGQKNLIGQYSNFAFTEHVTSTFNSQYYVVVNPLSGSAPTNTALEASPSNRNNNITILIDKVKSYKTFSLTESFSIGDNGWNEDTSSNGNSTTGTYDDTTGAWSGTNDQTGQPENFNDLPIGGGNTPLVGGNNSINDWLQDIANTIKGFFSGAIGAVTTLVSSGSAFINQLAGLYSWLPPAVYSVLVSALVIVITIGVIKVFI